MAQETCAGCPQQRDLVRVVGIVAPLCPTGVSIQEKFVLSRPKGYIHRRPVPGAPSSGTPRESQAGPCGDCRKIPCERALGISVRGK